MPCVAQFSRQSREGSHRISQEKSRHLQQASSRRSQRHPCPRRRRVVAASCLPRSRLLNARARSHLDEHLPKRMPPGRCCQMQPRLTRTGGNCRVGYGPPHGAMTKRRLPSAQTRAIHPLLSWTESTDLAGALLREALACAEREACAGLSSRHSVATPELQCSTPRRLREAVHELMMTVLARQLVAPSVLHRHEPQCHCGSSVVARQLHRVRGAKRSEGQGLPALP